MDRPLRLHFFGEDRCHEAFGRALIGRVTAELGIAAAVRTAHARGGHAQMLNELRSSPQSALQPRPDAFVVLHDSNCSGFASIRDAVVAVLAPAIREFAVVGCPEPYVERWFLADPHAFARVIGAACPRDPGKCEADLYKQLVGQAVAAAGLPVLTGIDELAPDIVNEMDLYQAGKRQASLDAFVSDLRALVKRLRS